MPAVIRVLVVSDHPVMQAGLRAILSNADDLQVTGTTVLDGLVTEAIESRPDVILLDAADEDIDWLDSLWQLSGQVPGIAVIALSRDPGELRARQAIEAGARGYLLWDASQGQIIETIRATHEGLLVLDPSLVPAAIGVGEASAQQTPTEILTPRELEVLQLLAQGLPSKTIALRLQLSEHTVKYHVGSIMGKLGAASRTEAVTIAARRGLITI